MRFVLDEAKFPSIDMRYVLSSPITTYTQFTLTTRSGSNSARRRASGGYGPGVKDGEKALGAVETKLIALADRAQTVYTPGALFVVARRTSTSDATPTWTANAMSPFATLVDAADVERRTGVVLEGEQAEAVRTALAQGPAWRFGSLAAELRSRPALPHERTEVPTVPLAPAPAPRTGSQPGDQLPSPPPMAVPAPPPPVVVSPPPAPAARRRRRRRRRSSQHLRRPRPRRRSSRRRPRRQRLPRPVPPSRTGTPTTSISRVCRSCSRT